MKTSKNLIIASLLISGIACGTAMADSKCSDVNIQVTNDFHDPITNAAVDIKVTDFQYWDKEDAKWRDEVTDNKRINPGQTAVWTKNLEYVGGEAGVKIKVFFKYDQAGGSGTTWSVEHTQQSGSFTCIDGTPVEIFIS